MSRKRNAQLPDWALWIIVTSTVLAAAILIFAAVLGVRAGQQQLEIQTRQRLGIHLQQALDYRTDGNLEAALAEYNKVLMLDPSNVAAVEGIESLLQIAQSTSSAAVTDAAATTNNEPASADVPVQEPSTTVDAPIPPQSPVASPTPTGSPALSELEKVWEQAQIAYTSGQWQKAVDRLVQMQALEPAFEAGKVTDMLFTAYVNLGAEKDRSGNLEEALALVDKALELNPGATELRTARRIAADYLDVLTYFGADWAKSVELLEEIYTQNPNYRDVEARLQEAYVAYGETLYEAEDWCAAEETFIAALDLDVTPGLIDKRDSARTRCTDRPIAAVSTRQPENATRNTPVAPEDEADDPELTEEEERATATPPPAPGAPVRGRILLAASDPGDGRSRVFALDVNDGSTQLLVDDGTQAAMRNDGVRIVYYNTRQDMAGISSFDPGTELNLRFTTYAEDRRPTWSAEGNRIAISSNREGDRRWRVYVVWAEADGATTTLGFGESPAWHPTEDRIAFRGCDETGNRCGLWSMTSSGSSRTPMTSVPEDTLPSWSPNGRYVVFTSNGRHGNYELYRADAQTGDVLRLTDHPANDGAGAVSPDGAWVAFLSDRNGVWQVWATPINGGPATPLVDVPGNIGSWLEQSIQWIE